MKEKIVLAAITVNYNYLLTKHYYKLPSLGIGYIAAVLENNGYSVSIIDKNISTQDTASLAAEISAAQPDVIGFYAVSETYDIVLKILKKIKIISPEVRTIIGGPHVYGIPAQPLENDWIDYAFRGEAEESFLKLLQINFDQDKLEHIPGLIFRQGKHIKINEMALVKDLDSLPLPARHLYPPLDFYRPSILAYKRLPATGILTSRGCAHKCIFCHSGKGHFQLRFHSPEYVLHEIKTLKNDYGINEIIIFDDTFLIHRKRAIQICEGIIQNKLDISWSCNARVNNIDAELLDIMKKAGCWLVQVGVESGNQKILDGIKKGITLEQIEKACRLIFKAGLGVKAYFILGHPNETEETLNDTIKFMNKLPLHFSAINFMTPLPGTELWDVAKHFGKFDKDRLEKVNYLSDRPGFIPKGVSEKILVEKSREAYLKFYLNPRTIYRNLRLISSLSDISKLFAAGTILLNILLSKWFKDKN